VLSVLSRTWGGRLTGQLQPIDLRRLNFVARASELRIPMLILHSADDTYVPPTASRALARLRPDIVTYDEFAVAGHTRLWNYDPERWNASIAGWLGRLPAYGAPTVTSPLPEASGPTPPMASGPS
jgi:pimeloyl-ACP methyl ester carboxylesterase